MESYDFGERLHCPACKHHLEAATAVTSNGRQPRDGAVSLCVYCGEVSVFRHGPLGLFIDTPTLEELRDIMSEPRARRTINAFHRYWAENPPA